MKRIAAIVSLLVACGLDPTPSDGGIDAPIDAGTDAELDGGPLCLASCEPGRTCCGTPDEPVCVRLMSDVRHCGTCTIDCLADHRGDRCEEGQCGCGDFRLGCVGRMTSYCCIPPAPRDPYCANLALDRSDCGECGNECIPEAADRCTGGRCVCGDRREPCLGTPESTCCDRGVGLHACVDTTSDPDHCGACGTRCAVPLRCVASACVP